MSLSRRGFVRAAGLGSLGMWTAPWRPRQAAGDVLTLFSRHEPAAAGQILLCYNENPVGPGDAVLEALRNALSVAGRYPFMPVVQLRASLLRYLNLPPEEPAVPGTAAPTGSKSPLVIGVGSTEILRSCIDAFTGPDRPFVTASPSFDSPVTYAAATHVPVRAVPVDAHLRLDFGAMLDQVHDAGMVYVCNPNNPTGTAHDAQEVSEFIRQVNARAPGCMIVVDEAYHDYADDPAKLTVLSLALANPSVVVTRTFSKAFGMAGLRLGYGVGHPDTIARLQAHHLSIGENVMAMVAGAAALENFSPHIAQERQRNRDAREFTRTAFARLGFATEPSSTNFIFVPIRQEATVFAAACARHGVMVGRSFPPLTTYSRITIGTMDQMKQAAEVFGSVLATA